MMTDNLLTLLKDPQYIKCWYPSGGKNFEAIKYWSNNIGNEINPKHFIFTDGMYLKDDFEKYLSSISNIFSVNIHDLKFEIFETNLELFPNPENPDYKNELEKRCQAWMKEGNEIEIGLKELGIPDFFNELELIEEFKKQFSKNKNANLFYFYFNDISIWLLNCSNEEFYNYCVQEHISIESIMLYRHCDYEFLYPNEELIIKTLRIKEGIGSNSYMNYNKEKIIKTNFFWDSNYQPIPPKDQIALIKFA